MKNATTADLQYAENGAKSNQTQNELANVKTLVRRQYTYNDLRSDTIAGTTHTQTKYSDKLMCSLLSRKLFRDTARIRPRPVVV